SLRLSTTVPRISNSSAKTLLAVTTASARRDTQRPSTILASTTTNVSLLLRARKERETSARTPREITTARVFEDSERLTNATVNQRPASVWTFPSARRVSLVPMESLPLLVEVEQSASNRRAHSSASAR
ncbi:hypothetical protein PFISCL1PPCAC_14576, partial [Pristionchus fissidentatus]